MNYPEDLQYTRTDEWVRHEGEIATVGISDYAQHELGDVVYVELPDIGTSVSAGVAFGVVESVKAVSDLLSPISGEVVESNTPVTENPGLINSSPYGDGWLIKVRASNDAPTERLMNATEYAEHRAH
jgi:glycine cleavage system H protein